MRKVRIIAADHQFHLYQINYFPVKEKTDFQRHFLLPLLRIILWPQTYFLCVWNRQDPVLSNPLPIISEEMERSEFLTLMRKETGPIPDSPV